MGGDYSFKFELKGDKASFVRSDVFTVTTPSETALKESGGAAAALEAKVCILGDCMPSLVAPWVKHCAG